MSTVCIVGHGPSAKSRKGGSLIDGHDLVIRLKNAPMWGDEDYGRKISYLCASTETLQNTLNAPKVPDIAYWAWPKRGFWAAPIESNFTGAMKERRPLVIWKHLWDIWNPIFLELSKDTNDLYHAPNFSIGLSAILIAMHDLEAKEIALVGFDNLLEPNQLDYYKADKGKWPSRHDWRGENKTLKAMEKYYGASVRAL